MEVSSHPGCFRATPVEDAMSSRADDSQTRDTEELLRCGERGDREALDELFSRHRARLRCMIRMRLDRRLQGRIDDSDVLQEVYLEAARRLDHYRLNPGVPFFVWIRSLAGQKLVDLHRRHLGNRIRDVRLEVPLDRPAFPAVTSAVLAAQLLGTATTPSEEVSQSEQELKLVEGLEKLDLKDREVLVLRHFECLTNSEAAHELGIPQSAASKRYTRAIRKLKKILKSISSDHEMS